MHSGCFATTPKAAAEVALAFALGDLRTAITEVMDLDETVYAKGEWKVRMYGEAWTPSSPRFMQGAKEQVERVSEEDTIEGLAHHVASLLEDEPDLMVVWGSGGTLRRMGEHLDLNLTLLGIDVQHGTTVHNDLNEASLINIIGAHVNEDGPRPLLLLLSPMGGQGFLIGRGNLNSPDVLRSLGTATSSGWRRRRNSLDSKLRIDTSDESLMPNSRSDSSKSPGFRTTRLLRALDVAFNVQATDRFCEKVRTRNPRFVHILNVVRV